MERILVALDASPRAPEVLGAAGVLAQRLGAKLVLIRAVSVPPEVPPEAYFVAASDLPGMLLKKAEAYLQAAGREVPADLIAARRAVLGAPWQAICDTARELDVDLIIVGSHGYGLVDRLLGTTAAKVVNHADRSVLVVRAPERL